MNGLSSPGQSFMSVVVSISSHTARGHVGNSVAVFALQRLGFEVWDVPTVVLPYHPGHGAGTRVVTPPADLGALLRNLERFNEDGVIGGIVSGYLAHSDHAAAIAAFVDAARRANGELVYCCDPVMGDDGALYVDGDIAAAIRDDLIPRADIATPNTFELGWLTATDTANDHRALVRAARALGPSEVFVTSAEPMMRAQAATLAVTSDAVLLAEAPAVKHPPHGLGDLFATLVLAHRIRGAAIDERLRRAVASVHDLALQTDRQGLDEMPLAREQNRLLQSSIVVQMRSLAIS